jgi:hypothetical protein
MSLFRLQRPRATQKARPNQTALAWLLLLALLVGAFLRASALGRMDDMLHYDEAYNGMDALALLRVPTLTPFFPGNYGREAGWIYYLALFVAAFGARPLALRLAVAFVGVLTLAATYRLGREAVGRHAAAWATAALAVFYWPVHLNQLALRANLFPLVGALAFAALLRARRTDKMAHWLLGGALLGLLIYTYYSARLWMLYGGLLLVWSWLSNPRSRKGCVVALGAAAAVCLPMLTYLLAHPTAAARLGMVEVSGLNEIKANALLWARAWFQKGDTNAEFNLPGRPILDPALGLLFLAGVAALIRDPQRRRSGLFLLGLAVVSVLPSLLSNQAPHFLRAIGLTLPIALVVGVGAAALADAARRAWNTPAALVLPLALVAVSGVISYRDLTLWLRSPEVPIFMEQHINRGINYIVAHTPDDTPVYFSPFSLSHPVLVFRAADLAPRPIGASDSHYCLPIADRAAVYFSLTLYEPGFEAWLSQWADLTVLDRQLTPQGDRVLYTIYQAVPRAGWASDQGTAIFADAVQMRLLQPIPVTVRAGDTVTITLGLRALRPLDRDYSVFVHLYGDPTPYQGGRTWGQGDSQACATYPSRMWRTNETVVQDFHLQVPADTPAGAYRVAVGVYESPAGPRLSLTWPAPQPDNYVVLQTVQVLPTASTPQGSAGPG